LGLKSYLLKQVVYFFIFIALPVLLSAQQADSLLVKKDSVKITPPSYTTTLHNILKENQHLNFTGKPSAMVTYTRRQSSQDSIFYTLLTVIAILAFLRFFYVRYFNNLFRVFFNTSLRQSQLTDQLLQAKLPSLFFNIISLASGGLFIYFILQYFNWITDSKPLTVIIICTLCMAAIYLLKFFTLKFTGWVTGFKEVTNTYIFIIFLINKILGILLLPFIVVMAFSVPVLIKIAALIAILLIVLMFLLRFFRSYGLLQHQLKISRFHFFMYIVGIVIVPVLLIYKGLLLLLSKNI
jgi:hypothetical protein